MLHHPWAVLQGTEEQTPPTDNMDGGKKERRTDNNDTLGDSKKKKKRFLGLWEGRKKAGNLGENEASSNSLVFGPKKVSYRKFLDQCFGTYTHLTSSNQNLGTGFFCSLLLSYLPGGET